MTTIPASLPSLVVPSLGLGLAPGRRSAAEKAFEADVATKKTV